MSLARSRYPAGLRRGLSIVELLIGIAVGLFVLAGAAMVVSNQLTDNKRLLLETQISQDMRAAMDIIVRDIRRSGYSYYADRIGAIGTPAPQPVAYRPAGSDNADPLSYSYSKVVGSADDEAVEGSEFRGFRLQNGVIQVQLGQGNWQALTDASVVDITTFNVILVERPLPLPTCAAPPCVSANACGNQRITTREISLEMEGTAKHDADVRRRIQATVRVRNDGVCL